ncbi:MAG: hypothetical protein ACI398_03785 [Clostridium sp.]
MKKKLLSILTASAVSLTLFGISANNSVQATEIPAESENIESPLTIDSVYAEHYDFDCHNEYAGHAKLGDVIHFSVKASGGHGQLSYRYHITKNAPGKTDDTGLMSSSDYTWEPSIPTNYNVTVYVTDEDGNSVSRSFYYLITK